MDLNLNLNQTILNLTSVYFGIGLTKGVVTIHFRNLIYSSEWALERAFETQFRVICDSDMFTRIILNIPFLSSPSPNPTWNPKNNWDCGADNKISPNQPKNYLVDGKIKDME